MKKTSFFHLFNLEMTTNQKKTIALPRTKTVKTKQALKGYTESYEISIKNYRDPLIQLQNTRLAVRKHLENVLKSMKGFKYVETLQITFQKMSDDNVINKTAYFNSDVDAITNDNEISESLKYSQERILNIISIWISEGSGWTVKSVDNHYLNIVKYSPVKGSSYIKLPEELKHSSKGLVNIKNRSAMRTCV